MKARINQMMEDRKKTVTDLEGSVKRTKHSYSDALRSLEEISETIHQKRLEMRNQAELGERGAGVGSESPSPPPMRGNNPVSIDGVTSHYASSCNMGSSGTTVTSAQFSTSNPSSQTFQPPSVIYSSPEKARSDSYRRAISASGVDYQSAELDSISEDVSVDVDDEYMSLPRGHRDTDSVFIENSDGQTHGGGGDETVKYSLSNKTKKSSAKLKGLILTPVSAGLDPLQANLRISTKPHVAQSREPFVRPNSYPYSHNSSRPSDSNQIQPRFTPLELSSSTKEDRKVKESSAVPSDIPTPTSSGRRLLKVPSMQDFDESSMSDTESITSGTMLDDDQVEFLTMDFSKQSFKDVDLNSDIVDYKEVHLPPSLSHLQGYVRRMSEGKHSEAEYAIPNSEEIKEDNVENQ